MYTQYEIMSNRESISLAISRKNDVMPCYSDDGTIFFSKEETKEFIEDILNAKGFNYETDKIRKKENMLITLESLEVRIATFDDDDNLIEENYENLVDFIKD